MVVVAGIHHKGPLSADPGHKPAYSSPPMHAYMEYKLNETASLNSMLAKLLNQFNLQQHQINLEGIRILDHKPVTKEVSCLGRLS